MVKVCVVGCLHGELDKVYSDIAYYEQEHDFKTDIVLCCGDFQSIRNTADLEVMACPQKFARIGDFWRYYAQKREAPVLTVFVGGNHEASNFLQELPYGGWVAPNIWYMGYAGVVQFGGLRIAGMSGIYKQHDFTQGHHEHVPYNESTKRSAYHVRNIESFRLCQIQQPIDCVISHDWPRGIYHYGNSQRLIRFKKHFEEEIKNNTLGSPPFENILVRLRPRYWFSAHLHCKFAAMVQHKLPTGDTSVTRFLALDKCLPRREYLQFLDIEPQNNALNDVKSLSLDPEWLCILQKTDSLMSFSKAPCSIPFQSTDGISEYSASSTDISDIVDMFGGNLTIPENFEITAPVHDDKETMTSSKLKSAQLLTNPQTDLLCDMLELQNPNRNFLGKDASSSEMHELSMQSGDITVNTSTVSVANPDELNIDDSSDDDH